VKEKRIMTDARQPVAGTTCPDFESLSCYADGELDAAPAAAIAAHVAQCTRCASLATRLREGFEADDARRDGGIGGSGCGGEEALILYATGGLRGSERAALDAHLGTCDGCVTAMALLHRRLGVGPVERAVPIAIQRRAELALETGLGEPAPRLRRIEPRGAAVLHRVRELLRLPVLVPAALAASALLTVALHPDWVQRAGNGERSRAVAPDTAKRRVTAVEATVRSRPSMQSEVVATVRRGTLVEVAGEERDWFEVRLDGGRPGWVEREAFE
jgi:anti-sigma factor RsiW